MTISLSVKKRDGKEYVYICETFRHPVTKRATSRVLQAFGRKDRLLAENPNALELIEERVRVLKENAGEYSKTLEERLGSGVRLQSIQPTERSLVQTCTPAPYYQLWNQLGLSAYFSNYRRNHKISFNLNKVAFLACLGRIVKPASKRHTWINRKNFLFDFDDIDLNDIYRSLGILAQKKDNIIQRMNARISQMYKRDLTVALYDVTTFYFESFNEDELRRRGMSKEHRTQETQIVLGLMVDSEGVPITYEIFPGNTAEVGTLLTIIEDFRRQYNIENVTIIADSELNQTINLEALDKAGMKYIVGYPPYVKLNQQEQQAILDPMGWENHFENDEVIWAIKDMPMALQKRFVDGSGNLNSRCIATFSRNRYLHDIDELEKKWGKARDLVERGVAAVKASGRSGYKVFINQQASKVSLKVDLYQKRKKWAGYLALLTNIQEESAESIYAKLRQLWRIEENFRILKTNLQARPVYVWTPDHIRGHFLVSYIALVMQRVLQRKLALAGLAVSTTDIVRALESMTVGRIQGLDKGKTLLYFCGNTDEFASTLKDSNGEPLSLSKLCDQIMIECGLEPLTGLESDSSLKRKLQLDRGIFSR